jgi:small-conductance mechanosensitive channel
MGDEGAVQDIPAFEDLTHEERSKLLSRMSDEQVREILVRQLDAEAEASAEQESLAETGADFLAEASSHFTSRLANLPQDLRRFVSILVEDIDGRMLVLLLGIAVAGAVLELLFRRGSRGMWGPSRAKAEKDAEVGPVLVSLLWHAIAFVCFSVGAVAAFAALRPEQDIAARTLGAMCMGLLVFRAAEMIARFFLIPPDPALCMIEFEKGVRRGLYRYAVAMIVTISLIFTMRVILERLGAGVELELAFRFVLSILFVALMLAVFWQYRRPIGMALAGEQQSEAASATLRRTLAANWHVLATILILVLLVASYLKVASTGQAGLGLGTLFSLGAWLFVDRLLARVQHSVQVLDTDASAPASAAQRVVLIRTGRLLALVVFIWSIARIWGADLLAFGHETLGGLVMRGLLTAAAAVLIGYLIWEAARIAIDRRLRIEGIDSEQPAMGEAGGGGGSRLGTLLPLLKRFIQISLIVILGLVVLSSLGVNVAPLIAGAGVIGIAIGFGAQTLIRDIVSGLFFLLDDAFRLGEFVDTGDVQGTVEGINVRSLVLRHYEGYLHTVPYGEIRYLTNWSRDWATLRLKFRVPFETDMEKVRKIIKRIGKELQQDPELGPYILQPLKSQGVVSMDDSAMILRAKFTSKPGWQWTIRKEVYTRVQKAFEDAGIKFAYRRVVVDVGSGGRSEGGGESEGRPTEQQIAAAAEEVIAEEQAPDKEPSGP